VIQRAFRKHLLQRTVKLASYKYREKTEGQRDMLSPSEMEGLLYKRISQLYGDDQMVPGVAPRVQVELHSEFLLQAAPPLDGHNFLQDESLKESVV